MNVMTPPPRKEVKTHATRIYLRNSNLDGSDARSSSKNRVPTCEVEIWTAAVARYCDRGTECFGCSSASARRRAAASNKSLQWMADERRSSTISRSIAISRRSADSGSDVTALVLLP